MGAPRVDWVVSRRRPVIPGHSSPMITLPQHQPQHRRTPAPTTPIGRFHPCERRPGGCCSTIIGAAVTVACVAGIPAVLRLNSRATASHAPGDRLRCPFSTLGIAAGRGPKEEERLQAHELTYTATCTPEREGVHSLTHARPWRCLCNRSPSTATHHHVVARGFRSGLRGQGGGEVTAGKFAAGAAAVKQQERMGVNWSSCVLHSCSSSCCSVRCGVMECLFGSAALRRLHSALSDRAIRAPLSLMASRAWAGPRLGRRLGALKMVNYFFSDVRQQTVAAFLAKQTNRRLANQASRRPDGSRDVREVLGSNGSTRTCTATSTRRAWW